jgi:hypothetical protein
MMKWALTKLDSLIHRVVPALCQRSHLHLPVSDTSRGITTVSGAAGVTVTGNTWY